jgi:hypothetical protein
VWDADFNVFVLLSYMAKVNYELDVGFELHPKGIGIPFAIFSANYTPSIDIHSAVSLPMKTIWSELLQDTISDLVSNHIDTSESISLLMHKYDLTLNEISAIVYYTCDVRKYNAPASQNIYSCINSSLAQRNTNLIEPWLPYIFYLLNALKKLPEYEGEVLRYINILVTTVSHQYKIDKDIVWIAFTSTTLSSKTLESFKCQNEGTIFIIDTCSGKDISPFSLFNEGEILIMPNAIFKVKDILSEKMKRGCGFSVSTDVVHLVQKRTPHNLEMLYPL